MKNVIHKKIPLDIFIVLIWTIATVIFVLSPVLKDSLIRTMLGIPTVLFIPGYALITALFPKNKDLDSVERIALSFGLSIAVVPLLGLALNFTFGIKLIPILTTLAIYSIAMLSIANYRRGKLPEEEQFSVPFGKIYGDVINGIKPKGKTDAILTIILIFTAVLAIGTVYYVITTPKIGERFTEFYILGSNGKTENYPTKLKVGDSSEILVGVVNHEYSDANYTVQIELNNETLNSKNLILGHNQTWEENMTFISDKEDTDMKLEFLLFKENNFTEPYRKLHLWVNSTR